MKLQWESCFDSNIRADSRNWPDYTYQLIYSNDWSELTASFVGPPRLTPVKFPTATSGSFEQLKKLCEDFDLTLPPRPMLWFPELIPRKRGIVPLKDCPVCQTGAYLHVKRDIKTDQTWVTCAECGRTSPPVLLSKTDHPVLVWNKEINP